MSTFRKQMEAIGSALLLIHKLPDWAVWSMTCTNDDDAESPSVLNVFAAEAEWTSLAESMALGKQVDEGQGYRSYRQGTLLISLIELEDTE